MVNEMPRYDLTIDEIMSIISYLQEYRCELLYDTDVVDAGNKIAEIDCLIDALKKIEL